MSAPCRKRQLKDKERKIFAENRIDCAEIDAVAEFKPLVPERLYDAAGSDGRSDEAEQVRQFFAYKLAFFLKRFLCLAAGKD